MKNKNIKIFSIRLIFLLIALLIIYKSICFPLQQSKNNLPENSNVIFGWNKYYNGESSFEIQYPNTWMLKEKNQEQILKGFPNTPFISLESESGANILITPQGGYDRGLPYIQSSKEIIINGNKATQSNFGILGDGSRLIIISFDKWFPHNRIEMHTKPSLELESQITDANGYVIPDLQNKIFNEFHIPEDLKNQLDEMDTIISTFHFL